HPGRARRALLPFPVLGAATRPLRRRGLRRAQSEPVAKARPEPRRTDALVGSRRRRRRGGPTSAVTLGARQACPLPGREEALQEADEGHQSDAEKGRDAEEYPDVGHVACLDLTDDRVAEPQTVVGLDLGHEGAYEGGRSAQLEAGEQVG